MAFLFFLTQLSETLRSEGTGAAHSQRAIGSAATRHGSDLLALGFTVSQVVHDYGDICQAVTELAIEQHAPITTEEFRTLNGCLDTAIAEAVTEHARVTAESRSTEESERAGHVAHETGTCSTPQSWPIRASSGGPSPSTAAPGRCSGAA